LVLHVEIMTNKTVMKLRIRALDNGIFIVCPNCGNITFVNPKGQIIASSRGVGQILVQEVDLAEATECRKSRTSPRITGEVYDALIRKCLK